MTGQPAFEKTTLALKNDTPRAQTVALLLAVIILVIATAWLVTSPISNPQSQISSPKSPALSPFPR